MEFDMLTKFLNFLN